jgi:hypothetical protein
MDTSHSKSDACFAGIVFGPARVPKFGKPDDDIEVGVRSVTHVIPFFVILDFSSGTTSRFSACRASR